MALLVSGAYHLCNFGRGLMRKNNVKLFQIWASVSGGDVV